MTDTTATAAFLLIVAICTILLSLFAPTGTIPALLGAC